MNLTQVTISLSDGSRRAYTTQNKNHNEQQKPKGQKLGQKGPAAGGHIPRSDDRPKGNNSDHRQAKG